MTLDNDVQTEIIRPRNDRLTAFFLLTAIGVYASSESCEYQRRKKQAEKEEIKQNYQKSALDEEPDFFYDSNGKKLRIVYSF